MLGKRKKSVTLTIVVLISLFVFTACDQGGLPSNKIKVLSKEDSNSINKTSSKSEIRNQKSEINLVSNSSFEEGKVFNSGLYDDGKSPLGKPGGWTTKGQLLNDSTGWATDEAHSGTRSLKITNIADTASYWQGEPIILDKSVNSLDISVWTKTKDLSKDTELFIRLEVYLKQNISMSQQINGSTKKSIDIKINPSDNWQKTEGKTLFLEDIEKVVPSLYLIGEGTVWFDDLKIIPNNINLSKGKVLFNSNNKNSNFNIKPLTVSNKEDTTNNQQLATSNDLVYQVKGSKAIISSGFIPIENDAVYKLSGDFKAFGKEPSRFYFGYAPYTKGKKFISSQSVNYIKGSETELVKACNAADKVIYVKNAKNWKTRKFNFIAFEIDNSGNYSDLPNFNLSSAGIEKIIKNNDYYEIRLKNPCGKNYPIGTKIREHAAGGTYIYNVASRVMLSASINDLDGFKNFKNLITTNDSSFSLPKLYPKAKYVKIIMLANHRTPKAVLQFKNIKMESIDILN